MMRKLRALDQQGKLNAAQKLVTAYLQGFRRRKDTERIRSIETNIAVMKKWAAEGK
jgi:hypothetical protein